MLTLNLTVFTGGIPPGWYDVLQKDMAAYSALKWTQSCAFADFCTLCSPGSLFMQTSTEVTFTAWRHVD